MPTSTTITIGERDGGGAMMAIRTHLVSPAGMEHVLAMDVEEGMRTVFSQIGASSPAPMCDQVTPGKA